MEQDPRYNNENWNNTPQQGQQPYQQQPYQQPYQQTIIVGESTPSKGNNLAVASLVLGILSVVFFFVFYIAFILAVIGLIVGIVSVAQHRDGKSMAVAGIIISAIGLLISIVIGFLFIVGLAVMGGM